MPELISVQGIEVVNPEQVLFRYMSLAKAMDLITKRRLFFACIENLRLGDRNEGTVHADVIREIDARFDRDGEVTTKIAAGLGEKNWESAGSPSLSFILKKIWEDHRFFHASCWHAAEEESILMWNRYAPGSESIAIQTTGGELFESLSGLTMVWMGWVNYDPALMAKKFESGSDCFYKYPIFSGEKEVRLIAYSHDPADVGKGVSVTVDLNRLIKGVYVSPDAEHWFVELVNGLLRDAGLSHEVRRTELRGPR